MDAAESYRDWAATTPFALLARRKNAQLASWVLDRPTTFNANLRPMGVGAELVPIADWPCVLDAWGNQFGTQPGDTRPMLPLFRSFENQGTYTSPFYLPLAVLDTGPSGGPYNVLHNQATIESAWSSVDGAGHHGMTMMAGMKFAHLRNEFSPCITGGTATSWWMTAFQAPALPLVDYVSWERDGTLWKDPIPPGNNWETEHWEIDPLHPAGTALHNAMASVLGSASRIDLYLFDQMNGGRLHDNFSPHYLTSGAPAHDPGNGRWKSLAIANLFAQTLQAGRSVNPEFELSIEDPCEISLPFIALQGIRINNLTKWPGPGVDATSTVPAFQFVYGTAPPSSLGTSTCLP